MPNHAKNEVPWTEAEDRLLVALAAEHRDPSGRALWSVISEKLNEAGFDRSAQKARCRHGRIERGIAQRAGGEARNHCKTCGQLRAGHTCTGKPAPAPAPAPAAPDDDPAAAAAVATLYALARSAPMCEVCE